MFKFKHNLLKNTGRRRTEKRREDRRKSGKERRKSGKEPGRAFWFGSKVVR